VAITTPLEDEGVYRHAAVAADHAIASQAGVEMLQNGGNAIDAAVATSFCLSVVRPFSCGLGGGGFMLIYVPARGGHPAMARALNYRETSPAAVGPDFYTNLDDKTASKYGWRASGVPGAVAGLCLALDQYGTLDLKTVLGPAIRAAERGFVADQAFVKATREVARAVEGRPDLFEALGPIWTDLCGSGQVQVGDVIRNPDQARALRLIAAHGPSAFYQGEIAKAIDRVMREHDGTLTAADLRGYRVGNVPPLESEFEQWKILSMPPPSSGGLAMAQIFGLLDRRGLDLHATSPNSADYVHLTAEAMKHAFADRSRWLADPAFTDVPIERLLSPAYLDDRAAAIDMQRTRDASTYGSQNLRAPPRDDDGTSHFCVIDATGMAVACTETINLEFGSLACVPGFGFCLNNQMDDFTTLRGQANAFNLRQSEANLPQPGKRPLSSMSPTIVLRDGKVAMIAGGSGGPRIISATTQCLLNVMVFDMKPAQAVTAPRFHHQWMPDKLQTDKAWDNPRDIATLGELRRRGHDVGLLSGESAVQMIVVNQHDGTIGAACDPRKGGRPAGY
jgi:gamma-glutamyltranspeptidase/glutathione hydrolase